MGVGWPIFTALWAREDARCELEEGGGGVVE
jgi:hypothetical protein